MLLERNRSQVLLVDIQTRLLPHIRHGEDVVENARRLVVAAQRLDIPVTVSEQYVKGLGPTVDELQPLLERSKVFEKLHFSCAADPAISRHVRHLDQAQGRDQVVIFGTEAHICVLQSALGFKQTGQHVAVVIDASGSRAKDSVKIAKHRFLRNGIEVVTTEMVLFEWLHEAGTDEFRELSKLVK